MSLFNHVINLKESTLEIIVYLVDFKSNGKGSYSEAFLDFRTIRDYRQFVQEMGYDEEIDETVVHILNFYSSKRLRRNTYYRLNTDLLKQYELSRFEQETPMFVGYTYDIHNNNDDDGQLLLDVHLTLNPDDIIRRSDGFELTDLHLENTCLRVNNVGQGNCNEITDEWDKEVKLVYDIGASIHASKSEVANLLQKRISAYRDSNPKPLLILSHWDLDHVAQLKVIANPEECFSGLVCPAKIPSLTSQKLFEKMKAALTGNKTLSLVPDKYKKGSLSIKRVTRHSLRSYALYQGINSWNVNYCGLVLIVNCYNGSYVLTGDCSWKQLLLICWQNHCDIKKDKIVLVVPHHGAKISNMRGNYRQYYNKLKIAITHFYNPVSAIISVDEGDNNYGHPCPSTIKALEDSFEEVKRTDKDGDVIKYLGL